MAGSLCSASSPSMAALGPFLLGHGEPLPSLLLSASCLRMLRDISVCDGRVKWTRRRRCVCAYVELHSTLSCLHRTCSHVYSAVESMCELAVGLRYRGIAVPSCSGRHSASSSPRPSPCAHSIFPSASLAPLGFLHFLLQIAESCAAPLTPTGYSILCVAKSRSCTVASVSLLCGSDPCRHAIIFVK